MRAAALLYAEALFALFGDEATLNAAVNTLTQPPQLWAVLLHPGVSAAQKKRVLIALLSDYPQTLQDFFALLCDKRRMNLLPSLQQAYHGLCLKQQNAMDASLRSAVPFDTDAQNQLSAGLCTLHGKSHVQLTATIDPFLLGGFVLEAEGITYDRSMKSALRTLHGTLKAR